MAYKIKIDSPSQGDLFGNFALGEPFVYAGQLYVKTKFCYRSEPGVAMNVSIGVEAEFTSDVRCLRVATVEVRTF